MLSIMLFYINEIKRVAASTEGGRLNVALPERGNLFEIVLGCVTYSILWVAGPVNWVFHYMAY